MTTQAKIEQLQLLIQSSLTFLVNRDYWLLEVPYYTNVGDTLIWQGELDFLRKLPYRCKGMRSYDTTIPSDIDANDIILLQGGGNLGDLWDLPQTYRLNVIKKYPNNKIVIFPQTVYWQDKEKMHACAAIIAQAKNLTICARDQQSYEILKANFSNNILLVPDMAFCIDTSRWEKPVVTKEILLLNRNDKESKQYLELDILASHKEVTVTDWLSFTDECWQKKWFRRTQKYVPALYNWYAKTIFRPYMLNSGIQLIGSHKKVYSTRLHAAILSILLDKAADLTWFDNSYGKNSNFYDTWLRDVDGITFIR